MPEYVYYIGGALAGLAGFIFIVAGIPKEESDG